MKLELRRYFADSKHTKGLLIHNGKVLCHTIEDPWHATKIPGETRIPEGTYKLGLRTVGSFHQRYSEKYPVNHKGMIEVLGVPNYMYILIHIGNYPRDTEGCILVGESANSGASISMSTRAYERVYNDIAFNIEKGSVTLEVIYV